MDSVTRSGRLRLAICQLGGIDKEANLKAMGEAVARASGAGAHVLVLPELCTTGYMVHDLLIHQAEPLDGPSIQAIARLAEAHSIGVLFGYPEVEISPDGAKHYFNSAIFIDKHGKTLLNYRKTHLYPPYELKYFKHGDSLPPLIEIEGIKIGVLICWDVEFPEPARVLTLQGAQLILVPTASMGSFTPLVTVRSRAFENHNFVAYVNRVGLENGSLFCGLSCVVGPDGHFVCQAGLEGAELLFADIFPSDTKYDREREQDPCMEHRRPHLYSSIAKETID